MNVFWVQNIIFEGKSNTMGNRILIIFTHPKYEKSINNSLLIRHIPDIPEITLHDLYEIYPDFNIDPETEKSLLAQHDIVIWQHPFYWYSAPPLMKQWIDIVLEFGWAYGPGGTALAGKVALNVITAGGQRHVYQRNGYNRFTIRELLAPFDQTATLCKMTYLPPFALHGTHRITPVESDKIGQDYKDLLLKLISANSDDIEQMKQVEYLNDFISPQNF
jgi:glutathione-regulated potassium-efflux system ancillary protein KefG